MCRYFGAAKQLPGVKELFEKEAPRQIRRTRHQLYQHIDADYYGFRDEEDGVLERVEAIAEEALRAQVIIWSTILYMSSKLLLVFPIRRQLLEKLEAVPEQAPRAQVASHC